MKRFILKLGKVEIHLSTFFFLFLSFISGRFQSFFFLFVIALIHELFHVFGALLFKVRVDKINIYPFGFSAKMGALVNIEWYKELVIVLLGPMSYFFSKVLINLLYKLSFLSFVGYQNANSVNLFILCFNLLPIIPLDGSRIIKTFLSFFLTEKKCLKINGLISILCLFSYILYMPVQFTIYIFLIYSQSEYWYNLRYSYSLFLISRLKKFKLFPKIHNKNDLYRNYQNIIIQNGKIYNEEGYIRLFL